MNYSLEDLTIFESILNHSSSMVDYDPCTAESIRIRLSQNTDPDSKNDLYTLEEVAQILSMAVVTIRQYVRSGKIHAIKQWRNWMVSSNEIARIKYEKETGITVNQDETMLVILDATRGMEDNFATIHRYRFFRANDLLRIVRQGPELSPQILMNQFVDSIYNTKLGLDWIEFVSYIPRFFQKTGDIVNSTFSEEIELVNSLHVKSEVIEQLIVESENFLSATQKEALDDINKFFGDPTKQETLLRVYKTMLLLGLEVDKRRYFENE